MRAALAAILLATFFASAGCSLVYQPDEADRPSTAGEVDAWFSDWYDVVLVARATCSGTNPTHARTIWLGPKNALLDRQQALFVGGKVRLDRELALQCLAEIAGAVPACTRLDAVLDDPAGACRRAFAGVVPDGADCASDSECRAAARCVSGTATCPGHCTRFRALGELCDDTLPCGFDLRCGYAIGAAPVGDKHCFVQSLGEGDDCSGTGKPPCGVGLHCAVVSIDPMTESCVPLASDGGSCGSSADCRPELFCDAGTCTVRIPAPWSCTPSSSGQCVRYAWCDDPASTGTGTCTAFANTGSCGVQPSGELKGCIDGECIGGSCTPFASFGGSCTAGQSCAPLGAPVTCDAGTSTCAETCL